LVVVVFFILFSRVSPDDGDDAMIPEPISYWGEICEREECVMEDRDKGQFLECLDG